MNYFVGQRPNHRIDSFTSSRLLGLFSVSGSFEFHRVLTIVPLVKILILTESDLTNFRYFQMMLSIVYESSCRATCLP